MKILRNYIVKAKDIIECRDRISNHIHNTPVLTSTLINELCGADVYFKCENFQKMGAFKMRGASNAVLCLNQDQKEKGVITHSSGNFAQALALAARQTGSTAYIVMPSNSPKVKKDAVHDYGGRIIESGNTIQEREKKAEEVIARTKAIFIHPYNDIMVILGQATCAFELLTDHPDLDYIFCPIGGGGLISGTCLSALFFSKNCKVIGGEPFEADDAYRSLISGRIEINKTINTIADGLRTNLGEITFDIIKQLIHRIDRVEEREIIASMRLIWERMKIVIEPSAAVAFAALKKNKKDFKNKKVGVILSGGNVDLSSLPF